MRLRSYLCIDLTGKELGCEVVRKAAEPLVFWGNGLGHGTRPWVEGKADTQITGLEKGSLFYTGHRHTNNYNLGFHTQCSGSSRGPGPALPCRKAPEGS